METNKSRESTLAIERLYVTMRHLFYKGNLKPSGFSGKLLRTELLKLEPEIYGSMSDKNKIEINGLIYVLDRLPQDIEECSFIHLISDEGFEKTNFKPIIPKKRRRNCYRIDQRQMNIEILLGRSEIYDILTHLTFLFMEADKIYNKAYTFDGKPKRIWNNLEECVMNKKELPKKEKDIMLINLASLMGRSYDETLNVYLKLQKNSEDNNRFFKIIYFLGKITYEEKFNNQIREIIFSDLLRERIGHHIYGERWAKNQKKILLKNKNYKKNLHIISANMHSVLNMLFAFDALKMPYCQSNALEIYEKISYKYELRKKIHDYANKNGMTYIKDKSGCNIDVQFFDISKINLENTSFKKLHYEKNNNLILVFDYAFGEQAYEIIDELLKPNEDNISFQLNVKSISIMGKAGILVGKKGDIMIPTAHIFEGTADNYPFNNDLTLNDFKNTDLTIFKGTMLTVLGTSLQNRKILSYFMNTSWKAIGLEMEGAHYHKAIQIASKIRNHISDNLKVRYAYYASDNPLKTGSTLSSGGLGLTGIKPTYLITQKILEKIFVS